MGRQREVWRAGKSCGKRQIASFAGAMSIPPTLAVVGDTGEVIGEISRAPSSICFRGRTGEQAHERYRPFRNLDLQWQMAWPWVVAGALVVNAILLLFPSSVADGQISRQLVIRSRTGSAPSWPGSRKIYLAHVDRRLMKAPAFCFNLLARDQVRQRRGCLDAAAVSWLGVVFVMAWLGTFRRSPPGALCGLGSCHWYFSMCGTSMLTLALIVICVPSHRHRIGLGIGGIFHRV